MTQKDLTRGAVFPTLCFFALPMILGNMLQQGYNIVDTWVVGRFAGSDALAAVGAAFALMTFLTSMLLGLCMGSGVVFSLCFGRQDQEGLEKGICASFLLVVLVAALLTVLSLLGVDLILEWMRIPRRIWSITREYLVLIFWGIPAVALYNFFGAYLKALGNSVIPLVFLGVATVLNIGLDILFVAVWQQGTAGAAAATILSQYGSGLGIGIYVLATSKAVRGAFTRFRVSRAGLGQIISYSGLTCVQQSVMNLGILMVQGLVNSFGTTVMAAFAAAVKVDAFAYMPAQEYGNAFSTFIAQNMGAGKGERVRKGVRCGVLTTVSYCLAVSLVLWFLAKPLLLIFIDPGEIAILEEGVRYLHIVGPFYCGIGCLFLFYGLYRAIGKPGISVVLTIVSLGTRVALAYTLAAIPPLGVVGIWWAIPIGWGLADLLGGLFYFRYRKNLTDGKG